jgi:hypothetical protein
LATEAPACLSGDDLRGGKRASHRSPRRASAGEPLGSTFPTGRPGGDADATSAWALR